MKSRLAKLFHEIRYDVDFVKSHTLQPKWYKILKVFILVGFLAGYSFWFGLTKTLLFLASFLILGTLIHLTYRSKTRKWTQTWLDFVVVQEHNTIKMKRIGRYYYSAILVSAIVSLVVSQVVI
jgi:hypothetical protein